MRFLISLIIIVILTLLSVLTWWWVFVLLCLALAILDIRTPLIISGLFLDSVYASEDYTLPVLTIYATLVSLASLVLRDRIRL